MTATRNSFDVFDTLIARRSGDPRAVLHRLERHCGIAGIAAARLAADQTLWHRSQPYLLADLWHEVGRTLGLDAAQVRRLHELEVALEHDEVIPIVENLVQVRDGDLLVSDTYLPAEIVASLLRRAGLTRTVSLIVSNDGKSRGWIWPQLTSKLTLHRHLGNDPHSDGKTPAAAGIPTLLYPHAERSPLERALVEHGWTVLANLIREARLANPFPTTQPQEQHLWLLACQLNFPLLYFASQCLEQHATERDASDLFFISRDCRLWRSLHQAGYHGWPSSWVFHVQVRPLNSTE